jgi:hypothetical protein
MKVARGPLLILRAQARTTTTRAIGVPALRMNARRRSNSQLRREKRLRHPNVDQPCDELVCGRQCDLQICSNGVLCPFGFLSGLLARFVVGAISSKTPFWRRRHETTKLSDAMDETLRFPSDHAPMLLAGVAMLVVAERRATRVAVASAQSTLSTDRACMKTRSCARPCFVAIRNWASLQPRVRPKFRPYLAAL